MKINNGHTPISCTALSTTANESTAPHQNHRCVCSLQLNVVTGKDGALKIIARNFFLQLFSCDACKYTPWLEQSDLQANDFLELVILMNRQATRELRSYRFESASLLNQPLSAMCFEIKQVLYTFLCTRFIHCIYCSYTNMQFKIHSHLQFFFVIEYIF